MKNTILSLVMMAMAATATAQTIGEAFYIYRNDGGFNAFFREEVDSIVYSNYDNDSIWYDDVVTQVIYTLDSIYRIPLASIDSVGFVQPETKYKDDAVPLTGSLYDYLVTSDSLSLTFDSSIPLALLPKVGDKIVATDLTEKLPLGFTGTVRQVELANGGYVVLCDNLALEEVVDKFYGVVEITGQQDDGSMRCYLRRKTSSKHFYKPFCFVIPTINQKLDLTPIVKPKDIYDIEGKAEVNVAIKPVITGRITRVVDNVLKIFHYNIHTLSDVRTVTTVEVAGKATNSDNPLNLSSPETDFCIEGTRPGPWGIPIYYAFGPKFELSGEIALGTTVYANFAQIEDINFNPQITSLGLAQVVLLPLLNKCNTINYSIDLTYFDIDWAYIAGKISACIAVVGRLGIGIASQDQNLGWVGVEAQIGMKGEAELDFDFEDLSNAEKGTGFYDGLKDKSKVVVTPYWGLEGKFALLDDRIHFTFLGRDDYSFWGKKWEWDIFPIFSDTKAISNGSNAEVTANITNDCIIPYSIGFSLFDENNNRIGEPQWNIQKYWKHDSFSFPFKTTFTDLVIGKKYKAYPTLRLFIFNVLASPGADLNKALPVMITEFKQMGSQYKKDGFTHDGKTYSYKYDVAVTVELSDADGVEDWGYVYKDPYGNIAHISLKNHSSPYTDTDYVYYRNKSKDIVTLYEYVKYEGEQNPVYGEPKDYEVSHSLTYCPDDHHPHLIDLGLPSGTKWACCNVGATIPEGYGGYYAWGETQEKSVYNWDTYQYGSSWTNCQDIGSDIADTSYDVAHVQWGGSWVMPSLDQIEELLNNCTYEWTTLNGVKGGLFTGSSGGSIFLPAAGDRWYGDLQSVGWSGSYWSSSQYYSNSSYAYGLDIDSGSTSNNSRNRFDGRTVRPVCR